MADELRWRSLPIADDFPFSLVCPAIIIAICVGTYYSFGGLGWALISAAFFALSMARFFLPTRCELTDDGARAKFLRTGRTMKWEDIRRVDVHKQGIHLSPFVKPSRLDAFRGTYMRFNGNADEVVSFVESRVRTDCRVRTARKAEGRA